MANNWKDARPPPRSGTFPPKQPVGTGLKQTAPLCGPGAWAPPAARRGERVASAFWKSVCIFFHHRTRTHASAPQPNRHMSYGDKSPTGSMYKKEWFCDIVCNGWKTLGIRTAACLDEIHAAVHGARVTKKESGRVPSGGRGMRLHLARCPGEEKLPPCRTFSVPCPFTASFTAVAPHTPVTVTEITEKL